MVECKIQNCWISTSELIYSSTLTFISKTRSDGASLPKSVHWAVQNSKERRYAVLFSHKCWNGSCIIWIYLPSSQLSDLPTREGSQDWCLQVLHAGEAPFLRVFTQTVLRHSQIVSLIGHMIVIQVATLALVGHITNSINNHRCGLKNKVVHLPWCVCPQTGNLSAQVL